MEYTAHTAIIGAGITGLCAAHALSESSKDVHIFEFSDKVGGAIQSISTDGYLAETGPNSLLIKDSRVAKLLDKVDLGDSSPERLPASSEAKKRYIVQHGKPHAMPSTVSGILKTPLFSLRGKLRILREPFIVKYKGYEEESFAQFVTRRFGRELLESAAEPFVSGIYAGNPNQLAIKHAFPRMHDMEQQHGSILRAALAMQLGKTNTPYKQSPSQIISFKSGMQVMPRAIATKLPQSAIKLETTIKNIQQLKNGWKITWQNSEGSTHTSYYENLILSVPHHKLASLPLPNSISDKLEVVKKINAPPVTSLVLGFKKKDISHALDGFGMLIKQAEKSPLLGVLFSSSMFDHRAPDGHVTLTCMMGGALHPEFAENDEQTVLDELKKILGVSGQPTFRHRTEWTQAIPQYNLDYQKAVDAITDCEKEHRGIHFAANYYKGISVGDCITNGIELGNSLASR